MPDKLQELTDKLYQEGLMKGKQEAEEVAQKAKEKAERIIAEANEKAAKIVSDAEKQADDLKQRTANDVKMASTQTISALKQKIEAEFLNKAVAVPVKEAMLSLVLDVCHKHYDFKNFEECSKKFKEIINVMRQMNFSEFKSDDFNKYHAQLKSMTGNE